MKMSRTKYQRRNWRAIQAASQNKQRTEGVAMLSKAADKEVKENSDKIAEAIKNEAVKGNASAARLLVELAEGAEWVKDPETVERVLNVFELLARDQPSAEPAPELELTGEIADFETMPGAIVAQNQQPPSAAYVN